MTTLSRRLEHLSHAQPRSCQLALAGSLAHADELGDLAMMQTLYVVQDEYRPVSIGQPRQCTFQIDPSTPVLWRDAWQGIGIRLFQVADLATSVVVVNRADGNDVQPGRERRLSSEGSQPAASIDPDLLQEVVGQMGVAARQAQYHRGDSRVVSPVERTKRALASVLDEVCYQRSVLWALRLIHDTY
jgi:hypothetical protein